MTLFPTIDEFREHVPLNASMGAADFQLMQADLLLAEADWLAPAIGEAYEAVRDAATGSLQWLLRSALANLAMLSYADAAQVQISGAGIQIISTDREKTAFQWQIDRLKASWARKGANGVEKVLAYLEAHADDYPAWRDSATARATRGHFITSAAGFSECYNISNARLTFQALATLLKKTERFRLEPALGTDFFDELRQQLRDGGLSAENGRLLDDYVRPALAHLVISQAIGELGFTLNGQALELQVYRADDANGKESDPGLTQLLDMKAGQALEDGEKYLRKLVQHLNATASATRYPTYFASDTYRPPVPAGPLLTDPSAALFGGI